MVFASGKYNLLDITSDRARDHTRGIGVLIRVRPYSRLQILRWKKREFDQGLESGMEGKWEYYNRSHSKLC